jgi:hypothetical protein
MKERWIMASKEVVAELIPEKKGEGYTVSPRYSAVCPFCSKENFAWPEELEIKRLSTGNEKCEHFLSHKMCNGKPTFFFNEEIQMERLADTKKVVTIENSWIKIEGRVFDLHRLYDFMDNALDYSTMDEGGQGHYGNERDALIEMGFFAQSSRGSIEMNDKGRKLYALLSEEIQKPAPSVKFSN